MKKLEAQLQAMFKEHGPAKVFMALFAVVDGQRKQISGLDGTEGEEIKDFLMLTAASMDESSDYFKNTGYKWQ